MAQSKKSLSWWAEGPPSTIQESMSTWPTSPRVHPRSVSQAQEGNGGQQVRLGVAGSGARPGFDGWLEFSSPAQHSPGGIGTQAADAERDRRCHEPL